MAIEFLDLVQGIFCLVFIIVTIIVGISIAFKYFKYHQKNLILVGIAWIGITTAWIPEIIELIIIIYDKPVNNDVVIFLYIILNLALIPVFATLWLIAFTDLLHLKKITRYSVLIIFAVFSVIFEVLLFYFYFTNLSMVGTFSGPFLVGWSLFSNILLFISILFILITGVSFARVSIRSDKPEIKLKGKLLLIAFIILCIGALIDFLFTTVLSNVIARSILASSSIMFYLGFILPQWIKNLFIKEV